MKTSSLNGLGLVIFALDQLGNRTQVKTGTVPENYTTNALSEYQAVGNKTFQYDLDGNLLSRLDTSTGLKTSYDYDMKNRLTKTTLPDGSIITFTYDALGRRIQKTVNNQTIHYLWDGAELLAELDSSGNLLRSYTHGIEVDEVLYQEDYPKGETLFFHQDNLMSTLALTDSQGIVKESYTYDPYGNLIQSPSSPSLPAGQAGTRFLYTGREWDSETSLYYNRARYYDPTLGRFITTDPKGYDAGLNLYTYVRDNPLSFRDPEGLDEYDGGCGGFGGFLSFAWDAVSSAVSYAASAVASAVSSAVNAVASAISSAVNAVTSAVSNVVNSITGNQSPKPSQNEKNNSIPIPPPARKEGETEQENLLELFDKMDKNLSPPNDDDNDPPTGPEDIIRQALGQAGIIRGTPNIINGL